AGFHAQVRPAHGGDEKARGGAGASTLMDTERRRPPAFLACAMEAVALLIAELLHRCDKTAVEITILGLLLDAERAALAMPVIGSAPVVLRFFKVGQHILIAPALIAKLAPFVIVTLMAPGIQHAVDHRGTAQRLAAW